jgi:predicted dehydrogenase
MSSDHSAGKKLRVGIAGYGVVGRRRRQFIDAHPALRSVAVCDAKCTADGVFEDGVKFFSDYRKLLAEELDVLFVCVPNLLAADVTVAGLERKLHVFCEKPPGRDLQDLARVRSSVSSRIGAPSATRPAAAFCSIRVFIWWT